MTRLTPSVWLAALLAAGCASPRVEAPQPVPAPARAPIPARAVAAAPEPTRWEQQVLVEGSIDEPTEMAVAGDGRVVFVQRKGAVKLYDPRTGEARQVGELEVNAVGEGYNSENGLIGVALDPSFQRTGWLYLTYTDADTLKHRVSRFTLADQQIRDEKVLLEVPITDGCCHTGGSMTFDERGNLLISFGDNTNPFATRYAPIDNAPGRELWDARRASANTQDLRGKILRITPQPDGTYTVPEGNLFSDPQEGRPEIYTMGHRNPYRISYDRHTGFLYWGEVGPDARVDSIHGPIGYDEVNQARGPGNFGWPLFIANNKPYRARDFVTGTSGELFDPQRPVNDSPHNTGARVLPPAQPAMIYYPYAVSAEFPLVGEGGRNAMAGPVYHYDDFAGSPVRLPEHYDRKFIHYDWIRGWMRATTLDGSGNFVRMEPFLDHLEFDHPIDVELGPDGSLYVLEYGTFWFTANPNARLSRIVYHAGNRPPVARMSASRTVGAAPLQVDFSAAGAFDHDAGQQLSYTWEFEGGGRAEGLTARHTFAEPGTYQARLTVRDPEGASTSTSTQIRVGNEMPEVRVSVQGNQSFFWDDRISYRVDVADREDGALNRGIDPGRVRVTLGFIPRELAAALAVGHQTETEPVGLSLMKQSDCMACHATDQASVGPSFRQIAERYAGKGDTISYLVRRILEGGGGVWGDRIMSAHPNLRRDVAAEMVRYVLSLASGGDVLPTAGTVRLNQHNPGDEGAYVLTAAYVDRARNGIGPLEARSQVMLRAPLLRAGDAVDTRGVQVDSAAGADGVRRGIATAAGGGGFLRLPPVDLTGVGEVRVGLQSLGRDLTVELRHGGADGALVATQRASAPSREQWFEVALPVREVGVRDLYLVLRPAGTATGEKDPLVRVDAIRFVRQAGR